MLDFARKWHAIRWGGIEMIEDSTKLVGTWKLVSAVTEDAATKEQVQLWGERPGGYLVLTQGGRWIVIQTAESRGVPKSGDDYRAAFQSLLAYSGRYRIDGNKITIEVDVAWDESWTGTEQVRFFRLEGNRLFIEAAPANLGGKVLIGRLTWVKAD
jgi:hypothetical protein